MKLGVTATRRPLTIAQLRAIPAYVTHVDVTEVHHGDCVNGDHFVHHIAVAAGKFIMIHPPEDDRLRAWCRVEVREVADA